MSVLRVIQVGVGGRGLRAYIGQVGIEPDFDLFNSERFEHVAFVEISEKNLAKAREAVPLPDDRCFQDLAEALDKVECDVVFVITPPQLHAPQCNVALDAGKHVLVEKPFTKSLADSRAIVAKAEANGLCVVVTQNRRYGVRQLAVRRLIESGKYGRVCAGSLYSSGFRRSPSPVQAAEDDHAYLWERGVHDLDTLLYYVAPRRPIRVSAKSFNPPFSPYKGGASLYGWIEFDDGSVVSLTLSFMSHGSRRYEYVIDCEDAAIHDLSEDVTVDSQIRVHPADGEPETVEEDIPGHKGELHYVLEAFYNYATQGTEPQISGRNNLATIELVESLGRSSDENRVIELGS